MNLLQTDDLAGVDCVVVYPVVLKSVLSPAIIALKVAMTPRYSELSQVEDTPRGRVNGTLFEDPSVTNANDDFRLCVPEQPESGSGIWVIKDPHGRA